MKVEPKLIRTIRDLRAYLDELEDSWTDEDKDYLGEFDRVELSVWYDAGRGGFGPPIVEYDCYCNLNFRGPRPEEVVDGPDVAQFLKDLE